MRQLDLRWFCVFSFIGFHEDGIWMVAFGLLLWYVPFFLLKWCGLRDLFRMKRISWKLYSQSRLRINFASEISNANWHFDGGKSKTPTMAALV